VVLSTRSVNPPARLSNASSAATHTTDGVARLDRASIRSGLHVAADTTKLRWPIVRVGASGNMVERDGRAMGMAGQLGPHTNRPRLINTSQWAFK